MSDTIISTEIKSAREAIIGFVKAVECCGYVKELYEGYSIIELPEEDVKLILAALTNVQGLLSILEHKIDNAAQNA